MPYYGSPPSYVLTRLHTRYDQKTLSDDLIFREAPAVVGGRANWEGGLGDQGAKIEKGGTSNFQGRYIIRHYWEQKVTCKAPLYGVWGGPPGSPSYGLSGSPGSKAIAATGLSARLIRRRTPTGRRSARAPPR